MHTHNASTWTRKKFRWALSQDRTITQRGGVRVVVVGGEIADGENSSTTSPPPTATYIVRYCRERSPDGPCSIFEFQIPTQLIGLMAACSLSYTHPTDCVQRP